jgi:hypothetical protein
MDFNASALVAAVMLLLTLVMMRRRQRGDSHRLVRRDRLATAVGAGADRR